MSNELQNTLDRIKLAKDTYLLSDNILRNTTILGVEGNLPAIYETTKYAALNKITTAKNGDIGLVGKREVIGDFETTVDWAEILRLGLLDSPTVAVLNSLKTDGLAKQYVANSNYYIQLDIDDTDVSNIKAILTFHNDNTDILKIYYDQTTSPIEEVNSTTTVVPYKIQIGEDSYTLEEIKAEGFTNDYIKLKGVNTIDLFWYVDLSEFEDLDDNEFNNLTDVLIYMNISRMYCTYDTYFYNDGIWEAAWGSSAKGTATAKDIVSGKKALVNGDLVQGNLLEEKSTTVITQDGLSVFRGGPSSNIKDYLIMRVSRDLCLRKNAGLMTTYNDIADTIGLEANQIAQGQTVLGIEGTFEGAEDLQEQLDAQDQIIAELQQELENKAVGSGSSKPNVFMQLEEPETKDGIWLKGDYQVDNIIADTNIFNSEEWNTEKMSILKSIPIDFDYSQAQVIGTDIYLFKNTKAYKYDTLTDNYTPLTDIPFSFFRGSSAIIGTDIYLIGSYNSEYTAYKYDTLTDNYTPLTDIPFSFFDGAVAVVGTDIYLLGGNVQRRYNYKYDTILNTYIKVKNLPLDFYYASAISIGTDIYLFAGYDAYKYDTLTDKYSTIKQVPFATSSTQVEVIGTNIYLLGGSNTDSTRMCYKYDILANNYIELTNIPYAFNYGSTAFNGNEIYLFGGSSNKTKVQVLTIIPKEFPNKTIIISQSGSHNQMSKIYNTEVAGLTTYYDRVYYQNEEGVLMNTIPTYNGNGIQWIKISGGVG